MVTGFTANVLLATNVFPYYKQPGLSQRAVRHDVILNCVGWPFQRALSAFTVVALPRDMRR
jgi:hypothetical protein